MSVERSDKNAVECLINDKIYFEGERRAVWDTLVEHPKGGWISGLTEVSTGTQLTQKLSDPIQYEHRIVIGENGKVVLASCDSDFNHLDLMDKVIAGGMIKRYAVKIGSDKNFVVAINNVDGSHSPAAETLAVVAFLLIGFDAKKRHIEAHSDIQPHRKFTEVSRLIDFIQKEFSPLGARIAYKLGLGEYPELIKKVANALKTLSPAARTEPKSIAKAIAQVMIESDLVVSKHRDHLEKIIGTPNEKKSKASVTSKHKFAESFFKPIPESQRSSVIGKGREFRRNMAAVSSETEQLSKSVLEKPLQLRARL